MRQFRYCRDPLFLLGGAAYVLNRWVVKPRVHNVFLHGYFNDLWLIPCALPLILWTHRKLGLRKHDQPPTIAEIFWHTVFWSVFFEVLGPKIMPWTTGDPLDVAAYVAGALIAGIWWQRARIFARSKGLIHEL